MANVNGLMTNNLPRFYTILLSLPEASYIATKCVINHHDHYYSIYTMYILKIVAKEKAYSTLFGILFGKCLNFKVYVIYYRKNVHVMERKRKLFKH
jgi:hypothetical protein